MSKTRFVALFFLQSIALQAQYEDLLRNPDIVWVAEYTTDYLMNPENEANNGDSFNYIYPIQLRNNSAENGLMDAVYTQQFMSELIFKHAGQVGFQAYSDSTLEHALSTAALNARLVKVDTVSLEPEDFDSLDYAIVRNEWAAEDIGAVRVRQVFWYDSRKHRFGSRLLAYAPVFEMKDPEGNKLNRRQPYFWLKVEKKPLKPQKVNDFAYIFQTKMRNNAPDIESFKVVKGGLNFKELVAKEVVAPSYPLFSPYFKTHHALDSAEIAAVCFGTDTLETFKPEDWEIETRIQPWNRISEITKIRFVQNWYYDDRRNLFYCRLVGWAPLFPVRDDQGNIRFQKLLFYEMYEH